MITELRRKDDGSLELEDSYKIIEGDKGYRDLSELEKIPLSLRILHYSVYETSCFKHIVVYGSALNKVSD